MIVNPWLFYLMNVCSSVKVVAILTMIASALGSLFFGVGMVVCTLDEQDESIGSCKKSFAMMFRALVVSAVVVVLVPSKETLLMMQAARLATTDNVNAVFEALKSAIDYAVGVLK